MLSGLAGPRPSSKLRYFVLEVLVEEMPFHGNFSHIVNVFGKTSTEKKTFSFGHCPNHLNPPLTPIRATWSSFFTSKMTFCAYDQKKNLMLIMKVAMIIMMIIMVILMIIMAKTTKQHTITVKLE